MLFRIESIKHSGTYGKRGTERTDGRYPLRIGRVVSLEYDFLKTGYPLVIRYMKDSDGTPMRFDFLNTSNIIDFKTEFRPYDLYVIVETENSIFEFKRLLKWIDDNEQTCQIVPAKHRRNIIK